MRGMRAGVVILLLGTLLAVAGPATAAKCVADTPYGRFEYECEGDGTQSPGDQPWWADERAQAIVGIVGLVASASAGAYAYARVRARRRTLSEYVRLVESTYVAAKSDPRDGTPKLVKLRSEVRTRHQKGRLEDTQFLELDKRITDYVSRLRSVEIDRRFGSMPPEFLQELHRRVGDGFVSAADVAALETHPQLARMAGPTRQAIIATLHAWAAEDQTGRAGMALTPV